MRNCDLLRLTMKHIDQNPETHVQEAYVAVDIVLPPFKREPARYEAVQTECGTAGCFAGWALQMSGHVIGVTSHDGQLTIDGVPVSVDEFAAKAAAVLGLSDTEAAFLFNQDNSRSDLHGMVDTLCSVQSDLDGRG